MDHPIRHQNGSRILMVSSISKLSQPPQISMDSKMWSDEETIVLLDIWGSNNIQHKLATIKRNRLVWEEVARMMETRGYSRSPKQCCGKIHNLKVEYRKVKTMKKDNFKFFHIMDPLMINYETLAKSQESGSESASMADEDHNYGGSKTDFAAAISVDQHNIDYQEPAYQQLHIDHNVGDNLLLRSIKMETEAVNDHEAANQQLLGAEELTTNSVSAPVMVTVPPPIRHMNAPTSDRSYPTNRPKKRRHQCQGAGLVSVDTVFDKLSQMQEESDKRFYAWEERRLRLEQEFQERRLRMEAEREARRERFIMQLVSMIGHNDNKPKVVVQERGQINRPIQPAVSGMPRIHTIISSNSIGIRRNRPGESFTGIRPSGGCL